MVKQKGINLMTAILKFSLISYLDISRTNVPNIRICYRFETLNEEIQELFEMSREDEGEK